MRKQGSAIIIALLLMSAVAGVAFAIGRLFYFDTSLGGLYENSTVAYYAAESGIEEGLLRYRVARYTEVPSADQTKVNRSNLATLATSAAINPATSLGSGSAAQEIYDLSMSYRSKFYGNPKAAEEFDVLDKNDLASVNYNQDNNYTIPRDEMIKIDVTDSIGTDLKLFVLFNNYATNFSKSNAFVEAKIVGTLTGQNQVTEYKKILVTDTTTYTINNFCANDGCLKMIPELVSGYDIYSQNNLRAAMGAGAIVYSSTKPDNRVFLYLRPVGADATIGISLNPKYDIASPFSTVKSTGYFGNSSRTLEAKIDRQSGTVYDLFDFVTYQHPK